MTGTTEKEATKNKRSNLNAIDTGKKGGVLPSSSARVMAVALFPKLRLVPAVAKVSMTVKSSSPSTMVSKRTLMDPHISVPKPEPGANVRGIEKEEKSPLVAAIRK
jgi:hypothetical protein